MLHKSSDTAHGEIIAISSAIEISLIIVGGNE
jgi:hypothetical protein